MADQYEYRREAFRADRRFEKQLGGTLYQTVDIVRDTNEPLQSVSGLAYDTYYVRFFRRNGPKRNELWTYASPVLGPVTPRLYVQSFLDYYKKISIEEGPLYEEFLRDLDLDNIQYEVFDGNRIVSPSEPMTPRKLYEINIRDTDSPSRVIGPKGAKMAASRRPDLSAHMRSQEQVQREAAKADREFETFYGSTPDVSIEGNRSAMYPATFTRRFDSYYIRLLKPDRSEDLIVKIDPRHGELTPEKAVWEIEHYYDLWDNQKKIFENFLGDIDLENVQYEIFNGGQAVYSQTPMKPREMYDIDIVNAKPGDDRKFRTDPPKKEKIYVPDAFINHDNSGKPHGVAILYDKDGKLEEVGNYIHGHKVGAWTTYDADGSPNSSGMFIGGKRNGIWYIFNPNGTINAFGEMKDDQKVGTWTVNNQSGKFLKYRHF